ncbi:hypothetical protein CXB51_023260 [Gossypium anomalum]|uniref:UDP-glucose 4-epimerase n=1 Tax=Gossypium anomalum TaxID=47600 RepID=A0A8J5YKV0_9ROSI|nr:hypothetical protein CXB51_023260 [Gossypium anomalum]
MVTKELTLLLCIGCFCAKMHFSELQAKVTTKCFFAIEIGDKAVGRIIIGLTYFIIFLCFCYCFLQIGASDKTILVIGGAGFIGTHTMVQLLNEGFKVLIINNLDNSVIEAVDRVKELVGPELSKKLQFNLGDLMNMDDLDKLFSKTKFDAVIHFTGVKAVGKSFGNPRQYFDNNLIGTINLYEIMATYNCKKV